MQHGDDPRWGELIDSARAAARAFAASESDAVQISVAALHRRAAGIRGALAIKAVKGGELAGWAKLENGAVALLSCPRRAVKVAVGTQRQVPRRAALVTASGEGVESVQREDGLRPRQRQRRQDHPGGQQDE